MAARTEGSPKRRVLGFERRIGFCRPGEGRKVLRSGPTRRHVDDDLVRSRLLAPPGVLRRSARQNRP